MVLDQAIATAAQEWGSRKLIVRQRPKTPEKHGWGTSGKVRRKSTEPMCPRVAEWRRGDLTGMASREGVGQRPEDTAHLLLGRRLGTTHHECQSADRIRVGLWKQDGCRKSVLLNTTMLVGLS